MNVDLKQYAICYFDVLGTTNRIKNEGIEAAIGNLWNIAYALDQNIYYRTEGDKTIPDPRPVIIKSFTDNFLIAREIQEPPFYAIDPVFQAVGRAIVQSLFMNRMLIRGAVVVGKMHIDDNSILGPAIVEAHRIENSVAVYPRIIVDHSVMEKLPFAIAWKRNFDLYFFEDYDGAICFNYLRFVSKSLIEKKAESVISELKTDRDRADLKEKVKYNWVINYLDEFRQQMAEGKIHYSGIGDS